MLEESRNKVSPPSKAWLKYQIPSLCVTVFMTTNRFARKSMIVLCAEVVVQAQDANKKKNK